MRPLELVAGVGLDDIHADEEAVEGTEAGDAGADGDGRWLLTGKPGAMGVDKDVLGGYMVGLLSGAPEEVLEHPGISFNSSAGTGALLLLGQEGIESALPAGGGVGEVGNRSGHGSISFL